MGKFNSQANTLRGHHRSSKAEYYFMIHLQGVKAYLLLRYCIKNQSIGVAQVPYFTYFGFLNILTLGCLLGH